MNCLYNQAHVASMLHSLASHDLHSVSVQEVVCPRWIIRVEVMIWHLVESNLIEGNNHLYLKRQ